MKNIILILLIIISCKSFPQSTCTQYTVVPLRTFTEIPENECYYRKDTQNELNDYEGTWKGTWNNKTLYITFKKVVNFYDDSLGFNLDNLVGKFKTSDSNGNILFNNILLTDGQAKIFGIGFHKITDQYHLSYTDNDLCGIGGSVKISFANAAKTQLNIDFDQRKSIIDTDCYYYSYPPSQYPEPLPKTNIVLIKQ
jgi:hypothetical protein